MNRNLDRFALIHVARHPCPPVGVILTDTVVLRDTAVLTDTEVPVLFRVPVNEHRLSVVSGRTRSFACEHG